MVGTKSNTTNSKQNTQTTDDIDVVKIIKDSVAKWYYIMRLIVIAFMLILLIGVGIKMAISTVASEKALYKQMLVDWVVGMIMVFGIHYIMVFILTVNENIVETCRPMAEGKTTIESEAEYGSEKNQKTSSEIETTLYESARTRAYSLKLTDGFTGLIIYGVLVYYAWKFALLYFKRAINIIILTLLAPAVAGSYAFNKVMTGKSKIFSSWLSEYIMVVAVQTVHVIMYVSFVSTALTLSLTSLLGVVLAIVLLQFMTKADGILRQIFKLAGGKGSLAGDMTDRSFRDIKNEFNQVRQAMVGGAATKMAMRATYKAASAPVRMVGNYAFGKVMEKRANDSEYKDEQKKKQEKDAADKLDSYQVYRNAEEANKRFEKITNKGESLDKENERLLKERDTLEKERKELLAQQALLKKEKELKREQTDATNAGDTVKLARKTKELNSLRNSDEYKAITKSRKQIKSDLIANENSLRKNEQLLITNEDEIKQNDKEEEAFFEEEGQIQDEWAQQYMMSGKLRDAIKGGAKKAFDPFEYTYYDEEQKKWRRKKTEREGIMPWSKKKDSIGKIFMKNMNWKNFLGISEQEAKMLEQELKFFKSSILGLFSGIAGPALLGVNPLMGMGLIAKGMGTRIDITNRIVGYRNSQKKETYKFKAFNDGSKKSINAEAMKQMKFAESELTRRNFRNHPELAKKIINGRAKATAIKDKIYSASLLNLTYMEQGQLDGLYQKKLRDNFRDMEKYLTYQNAKDCKEDYQEELSKYRDDARKKAEAKSDAELVKDEYLAEGNAVIVGGGSVVQIEDKSETSELLEATKKIDQKTGLTQEQKLEQIRGEILKHETGLIEDAITKYCASKGIREVSKLDLKHTDQVEIQQNIIGKLESTGVIKKGEIKLESGLISEHKIALVHAKLVKDSSPDTTDKIEQIMVNDAYLEYMSKTGITDKKILQQEDARNEIYGIIEKKISKSSKSTQEVIRKLGGGKKQVIEVGLPNSIRSKVASTPSNIKKKTVLGTSLSDEKRKRLVERAVNRQENEARSNLEEAIYTGDTEQIQDESQLRMLFLLSEIGKQNLQAEKAGVKGSAQKKEKTMEEARYFERRKQNRQINYRTNSKGSRNYRTTKSSTGGTQQSNTNTNLTKKMKELETIVHGPAMDLAELLNSVGT